MRLHELIEKRANAVTAMRALADLAEKETRDLTADEETRYGSLKVEIAGLDKKIDRTRELEQFERAAPATITRKGDGKFEERARDFSIVKAIRAALPRDLGGGQEDAGLEREISQEVAKRSGRTFQGIACPDEVFKVERRTLLVGSSAADLVPTQHRDDLFIDRLRSALVTERLGATVLDGLSGIVDIPRQGGSSSAQWVGEDGSLSESDATFDDVVLTAKTAGAMTSYSRRTLLNASPSIEGIVRRDLASILANEIDVKAMLGTGASNTPVGITATNGVTGITMGAPTWAKILSFIAAIEGADAAIGTLGWAFNSFAVAKLRATTKVSADAGAGFLMDAPGQLAGYQAAVTNALPGSTVTSPVTAGTMIFGDWSQLLIGRWTGVDILLNPYETTAYAKGRVLVRALQDLDIQVRHAASFAYCDDLTVS